MLGDGWRSPRTSNANISGDSYMKNPRLRRRISLVGLATLLLISRSHAQDASSAYDKRILQLENRIAELEGIVSQLKAKNEEQNPRIKIPHISADFPTYDGRGLHVFYALEPFDGKILHYDVLKENYPKTFVRNSQADAALLETDTPTLRIFINAGDKTIVLNNFRVLKGSIETLDRLMKQPTCKLPHEIWRLRYSALFD
jgi:hypothetical protein